MALSIQTNVASLQAQESLRLTSDFQARTINRLTSGYRINSAGDDAAGLAVANKFRSDVAELQQGVRNANDGVSQLQIVDGGLNNITKMLDRMKTLATQSASTTFKGNRNTLDSEYQALKGEISRQANNIGLNNGGTLNSQISVYTGGGSTQSNAQVNIDLSGSANAVDATSLGLTGNIQGGGSVQLGSTTTSASDTFLTGGSQAFNFQIEGSGTVAITVTGGAAGLSRDAALQQLNTQLASYGVTASFVKDTLSFSSSKAFSVWADVSSAGSGLTAGAATAGATNSALNTALYHIKGAAASAGATDELTFTNSTGASAVVTFTGAEASNADIVATINAQTSSIGIHAVVDATATDGFAIESANSFSVTRTGAGTTDLKGGIGATPGNRSVTAPAISAATTANALEALTSIGAATAKLGTVQGVVGTGQNQLQYAINLAQSQISSFSAAESRIRDADVAAEAANLTKAQVMSQASMAAMAQANSAPQAVLALLRG
jgi:flagellin